MAYRVIVHTNPPPVTTQPTPSSSLLLQFVEAKLVRTRVPTLFSEEIELLRSEMNQSGLFSSSPPSTPPSPSSSSSSSPLFINFHSGHPQVEIITGKAQLFRNTTVNNNDNTNNPNNTNNNDPPNPKYLPCPRSDVIFVVAIPGHFPSSEFCEWVGGYAGLLTGVWLVQQTEGVEEGDMKWRKEVGLEEEEEGEEEDFYMGVLKFKSQEGADMFYSERNLQQFNSMEPQLARLLFVQSFEVYSDHNNNNRNNNNSTKKEGNNDNNDNNNDNNNNNTVGSDENTTNTGPSVLPSILYPPTASPTPYPIFPIVHPASSPLPSCLSDPPPLPPFVELPTCPVCLERLDCGVTGLVTSFCSHQFHCTCLAGWKREGACPVCRFLPGTDGIQEEGEEAAGGILERIGGGRRGRGESRCEVCGGVDDLWICVLCGHVGCGRYRGGHANDHFQRTYHSFSLEIRTQRVWDYFGDTYVHRLLHDKGGEVVGMEGRGWGGGGGREEREEEEFRMKGKVVGLVGEYNFLLNSQLEAQREYYERRERAMVAQLEKLTAAAGGALALTSTSSPPSPSPASSSSSSSPSPSPSHDPPFASPNLVVDLLVTREELEKTKKDCQKLQKDRRRAEGVCQKMGQEIRFLKEINGSLESNQQMFEKKLQEEEKMRGKEVEDREKRIGELEDEVRDLSFFIEAQEAIGKGGGGELKDGDVVVVPNKGKGGGGGGKKKGRRR